MFRSPSKSSVNNNSSNKKVEIDDSDGVSSNRSCQAALTTEDWRNRWSRGRQLRCWVKSSLSSLQQTDEVGHIYETPTDASKLSSSKTTFIEKEGASGDVANGNEEEFTTCQNIDEALMAFSGWKLDKNNLFDERDDSEYSFDWLVDGLVWEGEETTEETDEIKLGPKKTFGHKELDNALYDLELEQNSTSTAESIYTNTKVLNRNHHDEDSGDNRQTEKEKRNMSFETEYYDESVENSNPLIIHTLVSIDSENCSQKQSAAENSSLTSSSDGDSDFELKNIDEHFDEEDDLLKYSNNWLKSQPLISNISTLEQRFFRRLQISASEKEKQIEEALAYDSQNEILLEHLYCSRDYNPFLEALNDLNHAWPSSSTRNSNQNSNENFTFAQNLDQNIPELEESLTASLCKFDEAEQNITSKLVQRIREKEDELHNAMYRVQQVDEDIHAASLYTSSSQKCLRRALSMHSSDLDVIKQANTRDRLRSLQKVILEVSHAVHLEDEITSSKKWEASQLPKLVENAKTLRDIILLSELRNLDTLAPMRERVHHIIFFVRTQIIETCLQEFLCKRCDRGAWNSFCSDEYKTLVQVAITVSDYEHEEWEYYKSNDVGKELHILNEVGNNEVRGETSNVEDNCPPTLARDWSITILKALCFEASRSVGRALLMDGKHDQSSFAKDLFQISTKINDMSLTDTDSASLRSLTHNLFSIRFEFCDFNATTLTGIFHRLCALLADVLHTHYLLTQWHLSPFDERNSDINFLHRSTHSNDCLVKNEIPHVIEKTNNCYTSVDLKSSKVSQIEALQPKNQKNHWLLPLLSFEMINTRLDLWKHIESVLVSFLDNYLYYSNKKSKQKKINTNDYPVDTTWSSDLNNMHDLLQLSNQILSLGIEFLGLDRAKKEGIFPLGSTSGSTLKEKLHHIFCKHLRIVHIEAMTGMGAMLSNETWHLIPLKLDGIVDSNEKDCHSHTMSKERIKQSLETLLKDISPDITDRSTKIHSKNLFAWVGSNGQKLFPLFNKFGNPFLYKTTSSQNNQIDASMSATLYQVMSNESKPDEQSEIKDIHVRELYQFIGRLIDIADPNFLPIATQSTINGLAKWTSRLLSIMKKLPIIADDIATVISNLFDLFFLTSFRLCMGNENNEKIVLGINGRSNIMSHLLCSENKSISSSTNRKTSTKLQKTSSLKISEIGKQKMTSFGKSEKEKKQKKLDYIRSSLQNVEADICAPLRSEYDKVGRLRDFILLGQESLGDMVDFNKIEEWITKQHIVSNGISPNQIKQDENKILASILQQQVAAAISCLFAAALLDVTVDRARRDLTYAYLCSSLGGYITESNHILLDVEPYVTELLISISVYSRQAIVVSPSLCHLGNRIAASRAMKARSTILEIISIGTGWTESTMHEHCNEYAEDLCDRCTHLWNSLVSSPANIPLSVLELIWNRVVEACYSSLLEGFSSIVDCSTEGRSLMSMDLATLSSGLNQVNSQYRREHSQYFCNNSPFGISMQKVIQCVDMYIKVFYFPEEDVVKWIDDNRDNYHLNQLYALIACGIGARLGLQHPKVINLFSKIR